MTKKTFYYLMIFSLFFLSGCSGQTNSTNSTAQKTSGTTNQISKAKIKADKIEVVHFHATQQCWSCITVGKYAFEVIKERFPKEYKDGTIIFRDVNGELPANKTMVAKYQARGSSLFINAIIGDNDNIEEDITVWRLVGDEKKYKDYFENKIKNLLE